MNNNDLNTLGICHYVLPGKYCHVKQYSETIEIVTFQTRDELQEYLDELTEDDLDDEDELYDTGAD